MKMKVVGSFKTVSNAIVIVILLEGNWLVFDYLQDDCTEEEVLSCVMYKKLRVNSLNNDSKMKSQLDIKGDKL